MVNLKQCSEEEVILFFRELGLPSYRAKQLLHWMYEKHATAIDEITEFSRDLRARLSPLGRIGSLDLLATETGEDGTRKFLFSLEDGERIESVLIPDDGRWTLCVSSQVGCAMGCGFCVTGSIGFRRNLSAYEITDQVVSVNRIIAPLRITNIVFMGMGEPLLNITEVGRTIRIIASWIKISGRRMTVSTCGIPSGIDALGTIRPLVNLAVSLNAPDDATRSRLMPVNDRFPLAALMAACRRFPLPPRRRITFEYVLLRGINDSREQARLTVRLLRGIPAKVNLIPWNPSPRSSYAPPGEAHILAFQNILIAAGITAMVRKSKGREIAAACGQLSARYGQ